MTRVREIACQFGTAGQLSGVLSDPGARHPTLGFVLITAGWFGYILYQQVAVTREAFAPMLASRAAPPGSA